MNFIQPKVERLSLFLVMIWKYLCLIATWARPRYSGLVGNGALGILLVAAFLLRKKPEITGEEPCASNGAEKNTCQVPQRATSPEPRHTMANDWGHEYRLMDLAARRCFLRLLIARPRVEARP